MGKCNASLRAAIIYTSDGCLTKYFVYISGEDISVAKAEADVLTRLSGVDETVCWDGRMG